MRRLTGTTARGFLSHTDVFPWFARFSLASMLWRQGDEAGAAQAAAAVLLLAPDDRTSITQGVACMLGMLAASGDADQRRAAITVMAAGRLRTRGAPDGIPHTATQCLGSYLQASHRVDFDMGASLREMIDDATRKMLMGANAPAHPPVADPFHGVLDEEELTNMAEARMCAHCDAINGKLRRCNRCRATYFCSTRCQHDAWEGHRAACNKLCVLAQSTALCAAAAATAADASLCAFSRHRGAG